MVRRWRLIECFEGEPKEIREKKARELIDFLDRYGFKAKIHAPLPEHKTSGHTHVTVLSNLKEKVMIGGISPCNLCGNNKWVQCYAEGHSCDDLWKFLAMRGDLKTKNI